MSQSVQPLATEPESHEDSGSVAEYRAVLWAVTAAFGAYFCMYGFRKPFTAASFQGGDLGGISFKTVLVTSQVAGYMISKFVGIRVIAEMPRRRRALGVLWLVLAAELALILFGCIPRPWNAICLFLNGLPLGMVFGLILGLLEGRLWTEALTAGLCASFILADGFTKSVGAWLLSRGVPEDWMPAAAGLFFLGPLALCVAMLARIEPPSQKDRSARSERTIMTRDERRSLVRRFAVGLIPLVLMYLLVTILRSLRADFAPEIWRGLGVEAQPGTFTTTEVLVALGVLGLNGAAVMIRDNRRAFFAALATCGLGFGLLAAALLARRWGHLEGFGFMVMIGLGLYLPYVAIHTTVFERMLAMTRERGTSGFLMYVADAVGYLGYVVVMLGRNALRGGGDLLGLLQSACWLAVIVSAVSLAICWRFFSRTVPSEAPTASVG